MKAIERIIICIIALGIYLIGVQLGCSPMGEPTQPPDAQLAVIVEEGDGYIDSLFILPSDRASDMIAKARTHTRAQLLEYEGHIVKPDLSKYIVRTDDNGVRQHTVFLCYHGYTLAGDWCRSVIIASHIPGVASCYSVCREVYTADPVTYLTDPEYYSEYIGTDPETGLGIVLQGEWTEYHRYIDSGSLSPAIDPESLSLEVLFCLMSGGTAYVTMNCLFSYTPESTCFNGSTYWTGIGVALGCIASALWGG